MKLPKRKRNRLTQYDYSTPNAYFITICTEKRKNLFWTEVGAAIGRPHDVPLTNIGMIVKQGILDIPEHYPTITVDHFVIMPNHIHLLLQINAYADGRPMAALRYRRSSTRQRGLFRKKRVSLFGKKDFMTISSAANRII